MSQTMNINFRQGSKTGSGCLTVFGGIFFVVGVGIFLWGLVTIYDAFAARSWQPVEATIVHVEQVISRGDDSTTYGVDGTFQYEYGGQRYTSSQLNFYSGTDNIGDYQKDFYWRLKQVKDNQRTITAYVNPDNPTQAVIDREIRWGMLGFQSIFLFTFGGIGLGIMLAGRFAKKKVLKEEGLQQLFPDEPWNWREEWQSNRFKANSSKGFIGLLIFAVFWNLISIPASVLAMVEYFKSFEHQILIVLLFPLVGSGLVIAASITWLRHKRYGQSEVILEQTPLAIGGSTRGSIQVTDDRRYLGSSDSGEAILTLTCQRKVTTGSGKNRSTKTTIIWQDDRRIIPQSIGANLSNFNFEFAIPKDLPVSNDSNPNNKVEWMVKLQRKQPGIDLKLEFELPAFVVGHRVAFEPEETDLFASGGSTSSSLNYDSWQNLGVEHSVTSQGNRYYFSAFRNASIGIMMLVFGLIFGGVGVGVGFADAPLIFPIAFGSFGLLMLILGLRVLTFKSEITVGSDKLYVASGHLMLGAPQVIRRDEIVSLEAKSNMSSGDKKIYHLVAHLQGGNKVILARNLLVKADIDSLVQKLKAELGMTRLESVYL